MSNAKDLAHISADLREQTVLEHLRGTAALAAQFAAEFGAGEQGALAGMAHDIGKYSAAFQRRLRGDPRRVDHAAAGALQCLKNHQLYAAFAVAGHHGGLPDGGSQTDTSDRPTFYGRMSHPPEPCEKWRDELCLPNAAQPPIAPNDPLEIMFFTRMLYSCLTDADFLDTARFMAAAPLDTVAAAGMAELADRLDAHCQRWFPPQSALNRSRCAILQRCRQQGAARAPGLFTLTIPTGGGKTLSSLAFALHHAKAHGLRRVVYVIPYTSIIEQNADVFRSVLGEDQVLEHHSGVFSDIDAEATPQSIHRARATENWDIPVVVTTAVQFFESLFANRSSKCRKLHNLAGSVVIFDEAQMLPIPYLRPCVYAIAQLVKHYRVSAVLCTATQPALNDLFAQFLPGVSAVELCPTGTYDPEVFRRVTFARVGQRSWSSLAAELLAHKQALCIVNTRKSARDLFAQLPEEDSFHLSTLMFPAHRRAVLAEIRARLDANLPCRVVATSLIEAGVDVDFPAVFREEAGLDSMLQAAGRCNREGKRSREDSVVTLFRGENAPPRLFSIPIEAGRRALANGASPDSPQAIDRYFEELLLLKGDQALDQQNILPMMRREMLPFRSVAEHFHLIDQTTIPVYVPLDKGEELVRRLCSGERTRELFRALDPYGVSVYEQHFRALYAAGDVELVDKEYAVLRTLSLYDARTGLSLDADPGKAEFI